MLTIRFDRLAALGVRPGHLVLDAGAGFGRHAFELARRGASRRRPRLRRRRGRTARSDTFAAMVEAGEIPADRYVGVLRGDATRLPFADGTLRRRDHVRGARARPRRHRCPGRAGPRPAPGGTFAATVPTWLPEKINWMLSDDYHAPAAVGGHVRIYSATELKAKLRAAGLAARRHATTPTPCTRRTGG